MGDLTHGPVDILLIAFPERLPDASLADVVASVQEGNAVALLDLASVSTSDTGAVTVMELEELPAEHAFRAIPLEEAGLLTAEDIGEFAAGLEPGSSALVLAFELRWARDLEAVVSGSGGVILAEARIPASVVSDTLAVG